MLFSFQYDDENSNGNVRVMTIGSLTSQYQRCTQSCEHHLKNGFFPQWLSIVDNHFAVDIIAVFVWRYAIQVLFVVVMVICNDWVAANN